MDKREFNYPEENGFSCANCKFWRTKDFTIGQCVRFPPELFDDHLGCGEFPKSSSKQWCGEWQIQELTLL